MNIKAAARCSVCLSVTCLMVLAQPSNNNQTNSNDSQSTTTELPLYSEKSSDKLMKTQRITDFLNYNSEKNDDAQVKIIDKNSNIFDTKIGLISSEDYWNLCWLVAAEAENQPIEGKMAVCGVVLNRTEYGPPFEDTITGVIFQENAFSCVSDGRFLKLATMFLRKIRKQLTGSLQKDTTSMFCILLQESMENMGRLLM